ncbi:uncharacterized protein LOC114289913 isoform X2 [Camellia sinensis]|uniref:uncharacterized protein LOC114289913 isoform X2 n=1 Tax=Camellia sinensis TaxID=4442 RepID=UPI001036F153|nr:uncharacterized protein LOC114289913 isoform X2 [Camellia sinensis]
MISVGSHLYPKNPVLHLGSQLNFSVEGLNDQVFGRWLSANESVIYVDMISGSDDHYYKSKAPRNNVQVLYDCRVDLPFVGIVDMQSHRRISLEIHIASSFLPLRSIKYILFLSQKT